MIKAEIQFLVVVIVALFASIFFKDFTSPVNVATNNNQNQNIASHELVYNSK